MSSGGFIRQADVEKPADRPEVHRPRLWQLLSKSLPICGRSSARLRARTSTGGRGKPAGPRSRARSSSRAPRWLQTLWKARTTPSSSRGSRSMIARHRRRRRRRAPARPPELPPRSSGGGRSPPCPPRMRRPGCRARRQHVPGQARAKQRRYRIMRDIKHAYASRPAILAALRLRGQPIFGRRAGPLNLTKTLRLHESQMDRLRAHMPHIRRRLPALGALVTFEAAARLGGFTPPRRRSGSRRRRSAGRCGRWRMISARVSSCVRTVGSS